MDPLNRRVTEALRSWRIQLEAGINTHEALELAGNVCDNEGRLCFSKAAKLASEGSDIKIVLTALSPLLPEGERATIAAGWLAGRAESAIDSVVAQRELWYNARKRVMGKLLIPAGTLLLASLIAPVVGLVLGQYGIIGYLILAGSPIALAIALFIFGSAFLRKRALERVTRPDGSPLPASSIDRTLFAIPILSHIEVQRSLAEFGSLMSNLIGAGVPVAQGLEICARAMRNGRYRESSSRLASLTAQGMGFATALRSEPEDLWPREFTTAVDVGERSGTLDESLARIAVNSRESYVRAVEIIADWLPKILYGCVAAFIVYNIFKLAFSYVNMLNDTLNSIGK